jgi:lysyl-tRNA synthetase class 2
MLSKADLELRAKLWNDVYAMIHSFFGSRGYMEVRTPVLVQSPGMEPNLDPVGVNIGILDRNGENERGGLITSPEYSMKKLLGGGLEKIYTVTPVFRDSEKMGERWSIEFTMLEWYRQHADYNECMKDTEELVNGYLGLTGEWPRVSYVKEFQKKFGVHPADAPKEMNVADMFQYEIMPELEKKYDRFFLTEYPVAEAALAQKNADGRSAQRFEGYVNGLEICNGFTELVDAKEQRERFKIEQKERSDAGKEVFPIDEELLSRLSSVASPTYGNALGVDRLVMLKAGVKDINAIHLFPPRERFI